MSLAWNLDRSGGSSDTPEYFGTGKPKAITRKSSETLNNPHRFNSSSPCSYKRMNEKLT